jgi:chromosomal replication initiator protein
VSAELEHIWSRVQAELASAVGEETYRIWLEPLRASELSRGRLSIEAPVQACGWVRDRFGRILQACATSVLGDEVVIELIPSADVHGGEPGIHTSPPDRLAGDSWSRGAGRPPERLPPHRAGAPSCVSAADPLPNPKLTFDQFVIGDSNRLAHAAALTVAEMPGQAYNCSSAVRRVWARPTC